MTNSKNCLERENNFKVFYIRSIIKDLNFLFELNLAHWQQQQQKLQVEKINVNRRWQQDELHELTLLFVFFFFIYFSLIKSSSFFFFNYKLENSQFNLFYKTTKTK